LYYTSGSAGGRKRIFFLCNFTFFGFLLLCFFDLVDFPVFLLSKIWYSRGDLGDGGGRKQGEHMSLPWVTLQDLQEEDINL
jgi:hypothetical protein